MPDRTGALEGDVSSRFRDQRLQAFKLSAPDRLHVPITARVPRLGGISNTDGPNLHEVRLRSARKFDPIPRIGGFSENDPAARDPSRHHPLRDLITEAREPLQDGASPLLRSYGANFGLDQEIGAFDQFLVIAAGLRNGPLDFDAQRGRFGRFHLRQFGMPLSKIPFEARAPASGLDRGVKIEEQAVGNKSLPGARLGLESRDPSGKRTGIDPKAVKFAKELVHLQKRLVVACAGLLRSPLLERDTTVAGTEPVGERPLTLGDTFGAIGWLKQHQPLAYSLVEALDGRRGRRKLSSKIDRDLDVGSFELREQCLGRGLGTPLIALSLRFRFCGLFRASLGIGAQI
ncbi:hypothetical protein IVB33_08430 [Bradyrhizobium sp. 24]|nr:hypothetical protein [Bradyrhizobium sp. 24]